MTHLSALRVPWGAGMHWNEYKIFAFFPRTREHWRSPADDLSGGEQEMVAAARALSDRTVALERGEVTHIGPSAALSRDLDLRRKVLWL